MNLRKCISLASNFVVSLSLSGLDCYLFCFSSPQEFVNVLRCMEFVLPIVRSYLTLPQDAYITPIKHEFESAEC